MTKSELEDVIGNLKTTIHDLNGRIDILRDKNNVLELTRRRLEADVAAALNVAHEQRHGDPLRERLLALAEKWNGRGGLYAGCAKGLLAAISRDVRP